MSAWTNAYCPCSGDRGSTSRRRRSARTRRSSRFVASAASRPATAATAPIVNDWPSVAASWTRPRSAVSSPSSRAAISACSVSGTASSPSSPDRLVPGAARPARAAGRRRRASGWSRPRTAGSPRRARRSSARRPRAGPTTSPPRSSRIDGVVERLQVEGEERPLAGAPARALLEQLGPGERDDQDRDVAGPLEHVLDEVEGPRVRPVEVLEQHHDDALRRDPLEERAPGGEQLGRPAGRGVARPQQREQRGLDPPPLLLVGHVLRDASRAMRVRVVDRIVGLEQARARADHLAQRPERDRPRRTTAIGPRATRSARRRRRGTSGTPRPAGSCRCRAWPVTETSRTRRSRDVAWNRSLSRRSSVSRPTNGASSRSSRPRPRRSATTRRARHAGTGAALPLSSCSPASSYAMASLVARWVRLAHEHRARRARPTGGATAVFGRSPATMPWPRGAERDRGLAGEHAARGPGSRGRAPARRRRARGAARTARSASSSWAVGAPHTAMTASPMNFSTRAAVAA